jgi:hypothetical protein
MIPPVADKALIASALRLTAELMPDPFDGRACRWTAFAVLIARPEGFDRDALAAALALGPEWRVGLAVARNQPWWLEQRVHGLLVALEKKHPCPTPR